MRSRMSFLAGLILVPATAAFAQNWQDAYDRHDYPAAAPLLQAAVFEHSYGTSRYPDVKAIQALAQLYAEGRGVAQDALTACALSNLGSGAAVYQHGDRDARTVSIRRQVEAYCVPLSAEERREAMQADGCLQPAMAPQVLLASAARRIELAHSKLTVTERGREREYALKSIVRCAQQVPLVRHVRVAAPRGSKLPARDFVEIFSWHSAVQEGQRVRTLQWSAVELTPQAAMLRARTVLERGEGSAWPARGIPETLTPGATFSMNKSGDVRWQMPGRTGRHGLIGRPAPLRATR